MDSAFPLDILPSSMSRRLLLSLLVSYRFKSLLLLLASHEINVNDVWAPMSNIIGLLFTPKDLIYAPTLLSTQNLTIVKITSTQTVKRI